jgi:hypothetical protein
MALAEFAVSLNNASALAIEINRFINRPAYRTFQNVALLFMLLVPALGAVRKVPRLAQLVEEFVRKGREFRKGRNAQRGKSSSANLAD